MSVAESTLSAEVASAPAPRARLLIVDDSRVIRKAMQKTLAADFDLIEAEDGEAGWNLLVADPGIAAIFSDVEMPRLDGHALLARIRAAADPRIQATPVVMVTGADDEAARRKAFDAGASDFITKPIDPVQLLARAHAQVRSDQTARKLAETETALEEQSVRDPLTQLCNRRSFLERATQALLLAQRHGNTVCLLRLDIDHFKTLFMQLGDEAVDQLLAMLARVLQEKVRREEILARVGGAELALLCPIANRHDGTMAAERLRAALQESVFEINRRPIRLSLSVGLATSEDADGVEGILAVAQRHLHHAKAAGGNRVEGGAEGASTPGAPAAPPVVENAKPQQAIDLDTVLAVIADGGEAELGDLPARGLQVLPLLEACNRRLGLKLDVALDTLRQQLLQATPPKP